MSEEQIKSYYERIEKLLNGGSKATYGFVPEEIRQILKWYEVLQQKNQQLKEDIKNIIKILSKNCDDLEATEEEFESLYRWENE